MLKKTNEELGAQLDAIKAQFNGKTLEQVFEEHADELADLNKKFLNEQSTVFEQNQTIEQLTMLIDVLKEMQQ